MGGDGYAIDLDWWKVGFCVYRLSFLVITILYYTYLMALKDLMKLLRLLSPDRVLYSSNL